MTSFNKSNPDAGKPVSTEIAGRDNEAQVATTSFKIGTVSGPVAKSDYKLPTLNIAQSVGDLGQQFEVGSIILNKELALTEGVHTDKPVKLTVLSFRKYFLERLPFGGDTMPRVFDTEEAMRAAGLHLDWIDNKPAPAFAAGEALVAIESSEGNALFPFEFNGKHYALAIWRLNSASSYNRAGKLIVTAGDWGLKSGLHKGSWTLNTAKEKLGTNWVVVPVLKNGPRNPEDLAEFFATLL